LIADQQTVLNLGLVHEAIAAEIPEREALVFRDRRFSWRELTDRTRRLADLLQRHGLGCRVERSSLENWESGQDHVGLYLHNGNEYLEGMLGAFKARAAPFNINYRYVDAELIHLLDNADARAVIFHARFAPTLARIREQLPGVKLWLQVADDSSETLLPGALDYEEAIAAAAPSPPSSDLSADDLYIVYTGGTTGMPKGVLWRQQDIFESALYSRGETSLDAIVKRAVKGGPRVLAASPFMHGAAHWVAFSMWHVGGTVVVQTNVRRLDPADILSTIEREGVSALSIVGDAFGRPLVDELRAGDYDVSMLRLISSGGATLTAAVKDEFLERIPGLRILDALGSSEGGTQGTRYSRAGGHATTGEFETNPDNVVLKEDFSGVVEPGSEELGWLARSGRIALGYYKDAAKTAETFPIVDGVRYSVPGDRASVGSDGALRLHGRDAAIINSGGEKIFAEEVEQALKHHPDVYDVIVVPTPDERWGQQVTALVRMREDASPSEDELKEAVRGHIAAYKVPKVFIFVDEIVRSPSGKADYGWAKGRAYQELGIER
jgi:acyl-CoA synthetase (AMP-forming)/AMP-acid ligase II